MINRMIGIKKLIIIEAIIFLVAGIITTIMGDFTAADYGKILFYCGLVPMVIGTASQLGLQHRPMPYTYRPSLHKQHSRDKMDLQTRTKFLLNSIIVSIIPIVMGALLMR